MAFQLTSPAFREGSMIPDKYSKKGGNISPPLAWQEAPEGTKTFALIVDDPDAPSGAFVHWLLYGIPADTAELPEGILSTDALADGSRQGRNGFGDIGYGGPQPPSGTHRYFFHLYALDYIPALPEGANRDELDAALQDHIVAEARLMGRYQHGQPGTRAA